MLSGPRREQNPYANPNTDSEVCQLRPLCPPRRSKMVAMVAVPKDRRGAASLPPWERVYDWDQRARLLAGKVGSIGTIIYVMALRLAKM